MHNEFKSQIIGQDDAHKRYNDYGPNPLVVDIERITLHNNDFQKSLWTGATLQVMLVRLRPGEQLGFEMHPDADQFLRIEQGQGIVVMGKSRTALTFQKRFYDDYSILIPAGLWHNVINTGYIPLKIHAISAPPLHPFATVRRLREDGVFLSK